ncbi:PucR family transcriptional regulator [Mycobacterium vicinigordonae]|uniref:Helix-turn-helix domain-containing protein n=1 Tax=Mycobacterium vicinigordonae TaxID=1719132 RepID=A0A7D6I9W5_9MYCO|nr:helix-turn-helix domain-containing protein [Mycobacterium vicinigordonae]QLL08257.1 helix-turn-helix domain-containing protein [Mycobacterium vicinigordonae]
MTSLAAGCEVDHVAVSDGVAAVEGLGAALLASKAGLARRIREAVEAEIPAYRSLPGDTLENEVSLVLRQLLRAIADQRGVDDRECGELAAIGERRARQGLPVDDVLRAWRLGMETAVRQARETGQRYGIAETGVLAFVESALAWCDQAMLITSRAHRRAERAAVRESDECHTDFVRGVLMGTISHAELRIRAEMYGLDPTADYVAVRACVNADTTQFRLEQLLGLSDSTRNRYGLVAIIDDNAAGFLSDPPPGRGDSIVGFGPPRPLERLVESYRSAARALVTAEACGLHGAYDIASLGLRPAIALDAELGELLRRRYLEPLAALSSEAELIATLRTYLACGMHVERTATRLFVHQNTVRYRIARFEELTGKDLSEIEVLLEVWWALEVSTMQL